ncbi:MAG: glycosyltransferase family 1 protein [Thermoplasmata archaeon]|nr:MAG: glycosyltransferase family 1 protein [Thermoplasmata archaeon]
MKIGIFSRWNATCGVAMHAELLGREFLKKGYELKVFAPRLQSANRWWHHKIIRKKDEEFVIRCYDELHPEKMEGGWVDENKILKENLDYLIVESYVSIPHKNVENLLMKIKKEKTKTIAVIHEGDENDIKYTTLEIFDRVVVFDKRYIKEVIPKFTHLATIIPYPCLPVRERKRKFAEDGITFFSFGRQPFREYADFISALESLYPSYDFIYKIVRSDGLLPYSKPWLIQTRGRLGNEEVYSLLHSSDIHLLPKGETKKVVVSSTLFQCLGSLTPTVVPNTRHFETMKETGAIVIYEDVEDLKTKLKQVIDNEDIREGIIKSAKAYVMENSSEKIAEKFIELLHSI